jgi:RNA polymerase sigma-70 factor (ECF subfamily)
VTDHYRRRTFTELPLDGELSGDGDENPIHKIALDQERERVRKALFSLPIDQRRVLELRFVEGWRHDEVADALGKTPEATRALQHRALAGLRRILLEDQPLIDRERGEWLGND